MEQLERLPADSLPEDLRRVLSAGIAAEPEDVYRTYAKLEMVHNALSRVAAGHNGFTHMFYFNREWEMIDNQYRAIEKQMHSNVGRLNGNLQYKISTCLYYACNLLTRYIVETSASSLEIMQRFRAYGFEVRL